jgi:1,2-diacylglycerol 3-alpha-glucosyltransferase
MIITIVCDVLGAENNGTTIAAMNLIRSLKAKGYRVRVVCPDQERKGEEGFYVVGTCNLGRALNRYVQKNGVTIARADKKVLYEAIHDADAVHLITPFSLSAAAAKMAKRLGKPLTAGFHCQAENFTNHIFMMNSRLINYLTYRFFHHRVYRYCDAIHYPSQFIRETYESIVGTTNAYVISNGVNGEFSRKYCNKPEAFRNKFVILFTGRYSKEKSHRILIEGVSRSKYREEIQLVFAGAGPQKEKLEQLAARKLPNKPLMRFFTRQELIEVINYADLYVHPAEIEIEAIACLEAIACGLVPVISDSPRSATRFFAMDAKNLFRCNDPDDLARKIDYWLEHPEERAKCSRAYLGYTKQFAQHRCMEEMEKMILNAVEAGR